MKKPENINEAVAMLSEVFVFMRLVQSNLPIGSEMRLCAGESCVGIEDSIRLIERIPKASVGPRLVAATLSDTSKEGTE